MAVFLWFWFFFWTDEITNEDFPRGPKNENPGTQLLEICECQRPLSATWETLKGFSKVPTRHCQPNVESLCVRDKSVGIVQIKESNLLGLVPSWCQVGANQCGQRWSIMAASIGLTTHSQWRMDRYWTCNWVLNIPRYGMSMLDFEWPQSIPFRLF